MQKIGFSGTLDPITNGHMWVIGEARSLADQVVVFLAENPSKSPHTPVEKRQAIIAASLRGQGWHNVEVVIVKGDYTARVAKHHGIDFLLRGIRNTADFDYENLIQQTNVDVLHGAKTLFVMPPRDLGSVSSSFVKSLEGPVGWHWTVKKFVPAPAYEAWIKDWLHHEWQALWRYEDATRAAVDHAQYWFDFLTGPPSYGSPDRHYHNLEHLVHGLSEIRAWAANTDARREEADTVRKAFWFHDAVYEHGPSETSNEDASAALLGRSRLDPDTAAGDLIRATDHFQEVAIQHPLKDAMLGADLAILGQEPDVYAGFAQAIREEYGHVPEAVYVRKRSAVLAHLLQKAQQDLLFPDPYFANRYQDKAIENLSAEIAELIGTKA